MATSPRAQVILDGDIGPLRQVLREGSAAVKGFGDNTSGAMGGLSGQAMAFRQQLIGIVGVITGGAFSAFIKHQVDLQDQFSKAAQKAGVTTEAYSAMAYAAKLADLSNEDLTKSYAKLGLALTDAQQGQKDAVELFRRLKLDPKNIKDADQLLLELADRFGSMENGAKKTALAIDIFGEKLGPRLIPFLNEGRGGLEELRKEAEKLGVVVSTQAGRDAEKFNDTLTTMGAAASGAGIQITKGLLPTLQAVADQMVSIQASGEVFSKIGKGLGVVLETISVLGANIVFVFESMGRELGAIAAQMGALARLDFKGFNAISEAVKADGVKARQELDDLEQRILRVGKYDPNIAASESQNSGGARFKPPPAFDPEKKTPDKPAAAKALPAAPTSYLQYYELQLAEEKRAQGILEAGREFGKERELAYWQYLLQNLQLTTADRVAILRKTAQLEVEINRKAAEDKTAVDAELTRQAETGALGKVEGARAAARVALDLDQITRAQFLQLDAQYEQQRYEIQRAALTERITLLESDPTSSPIEKERINGRLLELDQQYATRRTEILGGIEKESGSGTMFASMGNSFGAALDGLLLRTQTWGQSLGNIYAGVRNVFMRTMITEPFAQWVASQARMVAMKLGFVAQETAAQKVGSVATVGIKGAEATAVTGANAVEAGTGAAAAMASIPIAGPFLALAAMAAVFAAVSSLGSKSAARGYDIPSGINPMVQTHEEEMILPKQISNGLRSLIAEGGVGQSRAGDTFVVNLSALDSRTGGQWLHDNADRVASAVRKARRDNA